MKCRFHLKHVLLIFLLSVSFLGAQQDESLLTLYPPSTEEVQPLIEVVEGHFGALRERDLSRAYFSYTSKEFRRTTSLSDFTRFIKNSSFLEKNKTIVTLQAHIDKQGGYYRGIATSTDGEAREILVNFSQEDEDWKIRGIELIPLK